MESLKKQNIVEYIEQRRQRDGGYFFARVEPSSGLDTCLAVTTLRLLATQPHDPKSVAAFWKKRLAEGKVEGLTAIYLAIETFVQLRFPLTEFQRFRYYFIDQCERFKEYGTDLKSASNLIRAAKNLAVEIDTQPFAELVYASQGEDGGFCDAGGSHLSTTFYALSALNSLSMPVMNRRGVIDFLSGQYWKGDFLEDLFYIVASLSRLKAPLKAVDRIIDFVTSCRRGNGGFSRARVMGISTIEHTYMAVCVLKACEKYTGRDLIN